MPSYVAASDRNDLGVCRRPVWPGSKSRPGARLALARARAWLPPPARRRSLLPLALLRDELLELRVDAREIAPAALAATLRPRRLGARPVAQRHLLGLASLERALGGLDAFTRLLDRGDHRRVAAADAPHQVETATRSRKSLAPTKHRHDVELAVAVDGARAIVELRLGSREIGDRLLELDLGRGDAAAGLRERVLDLR